MKLYKLEEIVLNHRPITYGIVQPGPDVRPNGIPLIRGKDYSSGKVITTDLYHVLPEIDKPYTRSKVKEGDILLSIAGYVGKTAIVPSELEGANITQTTARISCNSEIAFSKFLYYALQSETFQRAQIKKYEKGSAQSGLNLSDVGKFIIELPSLTQQRKIAEILSTCDAVIEKTEAAIAKYQAIKQGMMHDLFTRGIDVKTGKLRPKQEEAPHLYKESELGWIPKEWEVKILGDVGDIKMCKRIFSYQTTSFGDVPFYKIGTFGKKPDAFISKELYRVYKSKFSFPSIGSILISASGTIGRLVVYNGEDAYFQDSNIVWIENNFNTISNEYLKNIFPLVKFKTEGGTIQRLYNNILRSGLFPCPSNSLEQELIVNKLLTIDRKLQTEQSALSKYQQVKAGLMQDLLSGKVEVKV